MPAFEANCSVRTDVKDHTVVVQKPIARFAAGRVIADRLNLLVEEPLAIRVQGKPYAVVMRTPGDETAHAIGFCLGEGIIDTFTDVKKIAFCGTDTNVISILLNPARVLIVGSVLERRGFISQTSCGICGKEVVADMLQSVQPVFDQRRVHWKQLLNCLEQFFNHQSLYCSTHTSHAAVVFDTDLKARSVGEDVGRHNAVDKAIGKLLVNDDMSDIFCMVLSSRISFELVQKAARADIPIVLSISRPTLLAVELAEKLNMTLAFAPNEKELIVYCGAHRINKE